MKSLISPLLLIFLLLAVALLAWAIFRRRETEGSWRSWLVFWAVFFISIMLYLPATWFGSEWLRGSLVPKAQEHFSERYPDWEPDWIVVLAGGIARGAEPEENVLSTESGLRTAHGISLARHFAEAGVIFAGGSGEPNKLERVLANKGKKEVPNPSSAVVLMQEMAEARGIAAERCRLESASRNTFEHPTEVLALDEVGQSDKMLIVSSDWHLRRARQVFDQVFPNAKYSCSTLRQRPESLWKQILPSEEAFVASTLYLREWVGQFWYGFKLRFLEASSI